MKKIIGRVRIGGTDGHYLCSRLTFKPYRMKTLVLPDLLGFLRKNMMQR